MHELRYTVTMEFDGRRVRDAALRGLNMSFGQFKRAKFGGEIWLAGERVHADARVEMGQELVIRVPEGENTPPETGGLALMAVYEDDDLIVIDKPAPLPSASSARQDGPTLEGAVYAHLGCPQGFIYRPVNRLDKGTSGLMVAAKNAHAQQLMQQLLHGDAFVREYLAVVEGAPESPEGVIDLPIGKADGATIRREVRPDGKPARTRYRVMDEQNGRSLVRLRLETGRTHQIRVHMAAIGCPVCGDFLYGREDELLPGRFALHSACLRLRHPLLDRWMKWQSPAPQAFTALLAPQLPR